MQKKNYFHSPFSEKTILNGNNRSLLLQFVLKEILYFASCPKTLLSASHINTNETPFFFTHCYEELSLHKIQEHATLLPYAFPFHKKHCAVFLHALSNVVHLLYNHSETPQSKALNIEDVERTLLDYLKQLFFLLEPFIKTCKHDGGLLLFLLQHHEEITLLTKKNHLYLLLKKIHPKKNKSVEEILCNHFHTRGFPYLIPKIKILLKQVQEDDEQL
jgi:hypothetical protein